MSVLTQNLFLMKSFLNYLLILVTGVAISACNYISSRDIERATDDSNVFFENKVPTFDSIYERIFVRHCNICHSPEKPGQRVLLDKQSLLDSPRDLILPGNTQDESGLIIAITRTDSRRMPPAAPGHRPLTSKEINAIKIWIANGAKD